MFMLAVHNGRERTIEDFIKLFKEADARYHYVGTTGGVDGSFQSVVEFCFKNETKSNGGDTLKAEVPVNGQENEVHSIWHDQTCADMVIF
jgi:hypothetical protein